MKLLIVEDEPSLREIMVQTLRREQYVVEQAADYASGLDKIAAYDYDCILLDIMLPDGNGLKLLEALRQRQQRAGVIIISARDSLDDKIGGLELGADDYLPKPYDLNVLVARVEARLRAGQRMRRCVHCGPLKLYLLSSKAYLGERDLMLTQKEFAVALYLARHRGQTVPAAELYQEIWQQPMADKPQALRMTITRLKQTLGDDEAPVDITS